MAATNAEILGWLQANPTATDADIANAMAVAGVNPAQLAQVVGVSEGEVAARVAATIPQGSSVTLGDTVIVPQYRTTGSGMDEQIGPLETFYVSKSDGDVNYKAPVGSEYKQYGADGTFQRTGTTQKELSFFGGLADAFNDPVVQAAFLGLGGGGALGNALGLTGSTAQAVGTGLFKGGAAAAGGADIEDALKVGLLSGGLVYGGNALNNYLTTGSSADVGLTERQFAIQDARQLADQGLTATQIRDTLSSGGYNDAIIDRALTAITTAPTAVTTPPVAVSTPVTDGVTITGQAPTSLNNVINTIAGTAPTVTVTAPKQVDQATLDLLNSQIAANVKTPANLGNVTVTGEKAATTQEIINAITATIPTITPTQAATVAEQVITSGKPVSVAEVVAAITATIPAVTTTIPTTTITATKPVTTPETINTVASVVTPPIVKTTPTTPDKPKETDPIKIAQLALAAAGLLGAGSVLSNNGTGTQFPIVPIPTEWGNPPAPSVAPYSPLAPINFGNRNLLIGTQWEKFLDPNYGQVPEPVQYSQPSNLSYNDLMGILGSKQGMPPASSLSINDIISGIQNQYGQTPTRTMG
jgi:hypothetical protein